MKTLALCFLAACAAELRKPAHFDDCGAVTLAVFNNKCLSCHNAKTASGELDLESPGVEWQTDTPRQRRLCDGHTLIDDWPRSLIFMNAGQSPCGDEMPLGRKP